MITNKSNNNIKTNLCNYVKIIKYNLIKTRWLL